MICQLAHEQTDGLLSIRLCDQQFAITFSTAKGIIIINDFAFEKSSCTYIKCLIRKVMKVLDRDKVIIAEISKLRYSIHV